MLVFLFSAIPVGLPMALGVRAILARASAHDFGFGTGAIVYAVVLASVFTVLMPQGNVLDANFQLKMPAAVSVGALIGLATGLIKRLRAK